MKNSDLRKLCDSFVEKVDAIYGVYLDGSMGFDLLHKRMVEEQENIARQRGVSLEQADSVPIAYDKDDIPKEGWDARLLHRTTVGELKARNADDSDNLFYLGNVCLVSIYQYWEDHFRKEIARVLNKDKNKVVVPVMGDIRHLRNSIIHNDGIAKPEVTRCELLKWFDPGEPIRLTGHQVETMVSTIESAMHEILEQDE